MSEWRAAADVAPGPVDSTIAPDGAEILLWRGDGYWQIRADGRELMDSRSDVTERALARLACWNLAPSNAPRVLVGGLGMGYTLRAALDLLPRSARVTVVEALGVVIGWNRGLLAVLADHPLDDPRVTVVEGDVVDVIAGAAGVFDAILLDVDNGPGDIVLDGNCRLYDAPGVARLERALAPDGVLAIWSSESAPDLVEGLLQCGLCAWSETVWPLDGDRRVAHAIVLAVKPGPVSFV
jgi:spermidine synthase